MKKHAKPEMGIEINRRPYYKRQKEFIIGKVAATTVQTAQQHEKKKPTIYQNRVIRFLYTCTFFFHRFSIAWKYDDHYHLSHFLLSLTFIQTDMLPPCLPYPLHDINTLSILNNMSYKYP